MMPLLLTESSFVLPFHSSRRYTLPLIVAAALMSSGEATSGAICRRETFTPLESGAEQAALDVEMEFPVKPRPTRNGVGRSSGLFRTGRSHRKYMKRVVGIADGVQVTAVVLQYHGRDGCGRDESGIRGGLTVGIEVQDLDSIAASDREECATGPITSELTTGVSVSWACWRMCCWLTATHLRYSQ